MKLSSGYMSKVHIKHKFFIFEFHSQNILLHTYLSTHICLYIVNTEKFKTLLSQQEINCINSTDININVSGDMLFFP